MAVRRLAIIHRWSGSPEADWYPWLCDELRSLEPPPFDEIAVPAMPEPDRPDPEAWVPAVADWLGRDSAKLAGTAVVGHSVGCQAVVRALATLPAATPVAGALLVAPWLRLDEAERDETSALWEESSFDERWAGEAAGRLVALVSDNDPFTSDWVANADAWRERLGAEVVLEPGAGHFERAEEPRILELIRSRFVAPESE